MGLTATTKNTVVRPCGFQKSGIPRKVKDTCLISRMRALAIKKERTVKIAVCITMYNESEDELQTTMSGVLQNYNAMYMDNDLRMRQQDFVVVLVCDGFD